MSPRVLLYPLLWLALTFALKLATPARVLTADEVDALAAGGQLAEQLTGEHGGLGDRLRAGFAANPANPRVAAQKDRPDPHRAAAEPPLSRWFIGLAVSGVPADTDSLERARWGAAGLLALAALLVFGCARAYGMTAAVLAALAMLLLPGAFGAASGAGSQALGAALAAGLLAAMRAVTRRGRGGVWVGVLFGLALGWHPAIFLLVPIFAAVAIAYRARPGSDTADGELPLPTVPLSVLLAPLTGVIVLVALWPTLWSDTTKHLAVWLTDTWSLQAPPMEVAGVLYDQASGRAPQAWTALAQLVAWVPLTVAAAWLWGLADAIRRPASAPWFAILLVVTLIVVGGVDGSLWGGRLSLLPLAWAPLALVAGVGAAAGARALAARLPALGPLGAAAASGVLLLALPLLGAVRGVPPGPTSAVASDEREPLPLGVLEEIAALQPAARVHIAPADDGAWEYALRVLWQHADLPLKWAPSPADADWLVALGASADAPVQGRPADLEGTAEGTPVAAWRLR